MSALPAFYIIGHPKKTFTFDLILKRIKYLDTFVFLRLPNKINAFSQDREQTW